MTENPISSVTPAMQTVHAPFVTTMLPPGSKSITNRALLLAALAKGNSTLRAPLESEDTVALRQALSALGAVATINDGVWEIAGVDGQFPTGGSVNLGDGGTPARFMLAAASLAQDQVEVDGSPRMRERPVAEGIELLRELGVALQGTGTPEHLPVLVSHWNERAGGTLRVGQTASSQFLSALMLIAPWTRDGITIQFAEEPTSVSYIELTVALLRELGVEAVYEPGRRVFVPSGGLGHFDCTIEPDASSAVYWWSAAALVPGASVTVPIPAASAQPDLKALALLESLGATVDSEAGAITVRGPAELLGAQLDAELCPDAAVMIAVVASRARGKTRISGLRTLRVKETDRIHALAVELAKTGCTVQEFDDAIEIDPSTVCDQPVQIKTWNDHRMAMAFGILSFVRAGVQIEDPGCVSKSYPNFWDDRVRLLQSATS